MHQNNPTTTDTIFPEIDTNWESAWIDLGGEG
jgi:hypothetical protein